MRNYKSKHKNYSDLAIDICGLHRISFDMFLFNRKKIELPTISPLITLTGGHLTFFHNYDPSL